MEETIVSGEYWVDKNLPENKSTDKGQLVIHASKYLVISQAYFCGGKVTLMGKDKFLKAYRYSHYIPTHIEMG